MPYKNKEEQRACQSRWYYRNQEKEQHRIYTRRASISEWYINYKKTLKCSKCPESDWRCLDFHHKDPNEKEFCISIGRNKGLSIESLLKEIAKCDVLCANCHRKETIVHSRV